MKQKWSIGLSVAALLMALTVVVNAQEEPPLAPPQAYEVTFTELGYIERKTTKGDSESYSFSVPGNIVFAADRNYVDLFFSHTTAGTRYPTSLIVTFNNRSVGTIPLNITNAEFGRVRLALQAEWFKPGNNRLTVALDTDVPCGEEEQIRFTATVYPESLFHLEYSQFTRSPDLATYPLPFTERSLVPETVYFVLPRDVTSMDVATAATISAGLGRFSKGQIQVATVLNTGLTDEIRSNHHLIVIGQADENRLLAQLDLPLSLQSSTLSPEHGVIQEIVSPWNPYKILLVVTGQTAEGVFKAGAALNRDAHFLSMKGQVAIVEELLVAEKVEQTERQVDLTFESLGYEDIVLYGSRTHKIDFDFEMPLAWQMTENPKLTLAFQHAVMIDPLVSSLDVRLNNVPIGGAQLDDTNRTNGILEIDLASWLLKPGKNRLSVQVKMDHPASGGDICVYLDSEQIWTMIRRDSFVYLSYTLESLPPDLGLFPYPFDTDANLSDLTLVLPDRLSKGERDGLLRLATTLGALTGGDQLALHTSTADALDTTTKTESNLVVVGQPMRNALIWELGNYLPQSFRPNSNLPTPGLDSVVLTIDPDRDVGFIQELVSPWNPERTILVVTGMTTQGVNAAFETLLTRRSELRGNLVVVEQDRLYAVNTQPSTATQSQTPSVRIMPSSPALLAKLADSWW